MPKPNIEDEDGKAEDKTATDVPLPQTLVRIPIEQQPLSAEHQEGTEKKTD